MRGGARCCRVVPANSTAREGSAEKFASARRGKHAISVCNLTGCCVRASAMQTMVQTSVSTFPYSGRHGSASQRTLWIVLFEHRQLLPKHHLDPRAGNLAFEADD